MRPELSWIERQTPTLKVAGSNPVGRTKTEILSTFVDGILFCIIHYSFFIIHHSFDRISVMNNEVAYADE